jgi:hypothetical protein
LPRFPALIVRCTTRTLSGSKRNSEIEWQLGFDRIRCGVEALVLHGMNLPFARGQMLPFAPRKSLHIHTIGRRGDLVDERGHVRDSYGLSSGDWVLVRPDGYVGALVSSCATAMFEGYLEKVGLKAA